MARQRRLNEQGTYHHITARGVDRCRIFLDDGDRRQFLALLSESRRRFGCRVLAFCLMDNHIHLTLLDENATLSKTLHYLNGVYAKKFNLKHGRTGHLFERRFWSSMLDSDAYLATCVKYVHRNPVEAGIVRRPEDHRWSSYPSCVGLRAAPNFLDMRTVLAHYDEGLVGFRTHTEDGPEAGPVVRQLESLNPPQRLGSKPAGRQATVAEARIRTSVSIHQVLTTCAAIAGVNVESVLEKRPGRRNETRDMVAFVAHRHADHSLTDIAAALGLTTSAAVSQACHRFDTSRVGPKQELLDQAVREIRSQSPTA